MLPTPDSNMGNGGTSKEWKPTRPSGQHAQLTLNDRVKMLTTPSVRDWKDTPNQIKDRADGKTRLDQMPRQVGKGTGLKLQPNFACWMMGYPLNWANLNSPSPDTEKSS